VLTKVLVANRGEIAVRIMATASDLGITTVAVHPADDADSLHAIVADERVELSGEGPAAYLDVDAVVGAAVKAGCDSVHPGYGFLAENPVLARACTAAGLVFVGPDVTGLELFGDKIRARSHARDCGVPLLAGTGGPTDLDDAQAFLGSLQPGAGVMVKAVAGGGGRGMRPAFDGPGLAEAYDRCASEARTAFGNGDLYVEELAIGGRHLEVQIVGDGAGGVTVLGDRECSIQRQRQKLLEIAPAPGLSDGLRANMHRHATELAARASYRSLATVEFLVTGDRIAFLEVNARIQVEHTVTEEVFGVDLVAVQFGIAAGLPVIDGLPTSPRGTAAQARINLERIDADGTVRPSGGRLNTFAMPSGPGVRVDTYGRPGYTTNPRYDSLIAKVIAHSPAHDPEVALRRLARALGDVQINGADTTAALLARVAADPALSSGRVHTRWFDENLARLHATIPEPRVGASIETTGSGADTAGARVDDANPLAVLDLGRDAMVGRGPASSAGEPPGAADDVGAVHAPLQGTIISIDVIPGDEVAVGRQLAVMEAMKMEHVISAPHSGVVHSIEVQIGTAVFEGHTLLIIEPAEVEPFQEASSHEVDLDAIRPDLGEVIERHDIGSDERRPKAVDKRRRTGQRTARENLDDLIDPGSYIEYGPLAIAPQRRRRSVDDLIENTPADGMIAGIGRVNGDRFEDDAARCVVMSYDYTVLAGTQGGQNHRKKDRLFELAQQWRVPVVFFTEGGGGRPGDTDGMGVAGLDCLAFGLWGELSGLVPLVGINSGYCFAGNAAILGCCDVIIATENSNIGMGGPAMIEGGGLGVFKPTEVGPMSVQRPNGVVDIAVKDEAEAVATAKQYLSYFQGPVDDWECDDQRSLRHLIPENRLRIYDIRSVIDAMFDTGSVLELRRDFGHGMVTALARVEGRPVGVIANNPAHLAGAIDSPAADKASRFMQLCDAFDLPIVSLCDTPGFMVGPEHEKTALVRHVSRMFVTARSVTVPTCAIVLRKGYGLGAQAMTSGGFKFPMFTVAWPTGEFGGMGLEGAVKLGYRKELEAVEDPEERLALYEQLVDRMYTVGKGVSMADHFEIDDVIDPVASRHWISTALRSAPTPPPRTTKKRPMIDTW
jgi:acetyl/propionyl-CoA carboxylase alpha subunit/acetyl-CoA carboxylase carboxyltransferase component